jgi:hypothetical protein
MRDWPPVPQAQDATRNWRGDCTEPCAGLREPQSRYSLVMSQRYRFIATSDQRVTQQHEKTQEELYSTVYVQGLIHSTAIISW